MMTQQTTIPRGLYLFILVGSAIISLWSVYADPIINIDGILYIDAAKALAAGDLSSALSFHKWPFYSYLIVLLHKLSGLELITSAHVFNLLCNMLTCIAFLFVIVELGGTRRTVTIAALVIVLFPGLNEVRSFVIRDHAYIALCVLSFFYFLRAVNTRSVRSLSAAMLVMMVANLFRIEALIFLLAMPLFYFYGGRLTTRPRRAPLIAGSIVIITVFIAVFGWWMYSPKDHAGVSMFTLENIQQGWIGADEFLHEKITLLKDRVLNTASSNVARLVYLWMTLGIVAAHLFLILSPLYSVLCGYALGKRLVFPRPAVMAPWKLFIYINIVVLIFFTLIRFFLTDRYPLILATMLLTTVPFALEHIYNKWTAMETRTVRTYAAYGALLVVLVATCVEGFTSVSSKNYLRESGLWLKDNTPPQTALYTNSPIVGFYSDRKSEKLKVVDDRYELLASFYKGQWIEYDYLALKVSPDPEFESHLKTTLWLVPVKVFNDDKGSQVRIYNVKKYRERDQK